MKKTFASLLVATLALALPAALQAATVYWVDADSQTIKSIQSDGTGLTDLFNTLGRPNALAADATNLYSGDGIGSSARITTTNFDLTSGLVLRSFTQASGMAVSGDYLYYTTWEGGVFRINKDGIGYTTNLVAGGSAGFTGICVTANSIYFTAYNESKVYKCDLDGGNLTTVYAGMQDTGLMDVFVTDSNIYIADSSGQLGLIKADLNGGNATEIATGFFHNVEVAGNTLYYTSGQSEVGEMNLDGSGQTVLDGDGSSTYGLAVVVDAVPEPSSFLLLGVGVAGMALLRRKSARK